MQLSRLYHTLRPLRWQQFWYRFYYPLKKLLYKIPPVPDTAKAAASAWPQLSLVVLPAFDTYDPISRTFSLLHINQAYPQETNWNDRQQGLLWTYHLNYFGWLQDEQISVPDRLHTIKEYTGAATGNRLSTGLDAYPISLRAINWIRFFIRHAIHEPSSIEVLYQHCHRLCAFPEYQLQGNHLWENGCALLFAGHYFREDHFYQQGRRIMDLALDEQLFRDGGHVEGSPMYHCLLLGRLLQCIELIQQSTHFKDETFFNKLTGAATRMLGWLQAMTFSNASYPMVNDSTGCMAPDYQLLADYATQLSIPKPVAPFLSDSGYRLIRNDNYELFVDISAIKPAYQPGHTHADTLSFCLFAGGREIIVDPGSSTYSDPDIRQWERSTLAHNTIILEGKNSSDVWKSFRVGRRANITFLEETANSLTAKHDGYTNLGITHCRSFKFLKNKIIIEDTLEGMNEENALLCLHFNTGITVRKLAPFQYLAGNLLLNIENAKKALVMPYNYAAAFNKTVEASKLCIELNDATKITLELLHAD
jgi:hypothetical protein